MWGMDKLADVLDAARTLSHDERRRLLSELDALEAQERVELPASSKPFAALRSLSGTAHSEFTDLSTDKYAHVAAAVLDADD